MPPRHLRIGTRGSPMALRQTALVRDRLVAAHPELAANGAVEIVTIRTTGDRVQDRLLAEIGGKGLFVKEIEEALIAGHIDLAVHSLKDLETWLPAGLAITCVLPRDDPRDAFLSTSAVSLAALPKGARVGTASLRRQAQLLRRRPDLMILPIRTRSTDVKRHPELTAPSDILDARSVTVFSYNNFRFSRPMARAGSDARGRGSFGSRSDRKAPEAGWASGTCLNLSHQR
jgi:hydroxymethylbilane synthase